MESTVTIEEQLRADQTAAMKAKDKAKLNAIRSVQSEVATAKSASGFSGDVDDALYESTISTYGRRLSKTKAEYEALGDRGAEQAAKLAFEIEYLGGFLPTKLDESATRELVQSVIDELGATADTPAGQVIGAVMRTGKDVDGALVNQIVRERLEAAS